MNIELSKNLKLPIIAAPLFLISGPKLVIECCKNGIIGTFPALNNRTTEGFEKWIIQIKDELADFEKETGQKAAPFGVNLILLHPEIEDLIDVCLASDGFFPFRDNIEVAKKYGVKWIIQPGGSIADEDVIKACNENDITMVMTRKRMFYH